MKLNIWTIVLISGMTVFIIASFSLFLPSTVVINGNTYTQVQTVVTTTINGTAYTQTPLGLPPFRLGWFLVTLGSVALVIVAYLKWCQPAPKTHDEPRID